MKAIIILIGCVLCFSPLATQAASPIKPDQQFVSLNSQVILEDDVIRLGDIFQGTGDLSDRVVAYAPRPGARGVFDARWLYRVSKAFKLDWRPTSKTERLVVERDAQVITKSEIEDLLHERLLAQGGDASSRTVLSNREFRLHLPVGKEIVLGVDSLSFDPTRGRFTAVLAWGNGKDDRRRVTGRFERMIEIPVLSNRMMSGDVIEEGDLKWIDVPSKRLARNAITDESRLVGMAAKRSISADRPVAEGDIRRPQVVTKGSKVTMSLSTPLMQLTTKGKALESGGKGDIIRISNSQTHTVVEGVVIGPGQVRVDVAVNLAMR